MPRPDRARAELAAIQRAAPSPWRRVIEGVVVSDTAFPEWFAAAAHFDVGDDQPVRETLRGLLGKRVHISIEVLPPEGDADAP